jgi:IMP cyclohydrolase
MSKFRKNKKSLSVNGKLPAMAFHPTMKRIHDVFYRYGNSSFNRNDQSLEAADDNFSTAMKESPAFISIVKSKKKTVKMVDTNDGKGVLISTGWLVDIANACVRPEDYQVPDANRFLNDSEKTLCLKILDIVYHVSEGESEVVETKLDSEYAREAIAHMSYGTGYDNKTYFPWLSRRYEKTSFYNEARRSYGHLEQPTWDAWQANLDWFKNNLSDKTALTSEVILYQTAYHA